MTEARDRLTFLEALKRIHDLPPLRAVQPKASPAHHRGCWGSDVPSLGQGRRSGGVLSLLTEWVEGSVVRW